MDRLEGARWAQAHGFAVFPVHGTTPAGACRCRKAGTCPPGNTGKHPIPAQWQTDARATPRPWDHPDDEVRPNYGIQCGNGLCVIDLDGASGAEWANRMDAEHGAGWRDTLTVRTGSGGTHYYYEYDTGGRVPPNSQGRVAVGVDVRGGHPDGSPAGYVVGPGSKTGKGTYTVVTERNPARLPGWLLDLTLPTPTTPAPTPVTPTQPPPPVVGERFGILAASGGGWYDAAINGKLGDLAAMDRNWHPGAGWDRLAHGAACRIIEVANGAGWDPELFRDRFLQSAPTDDVWTDTDNDTKWLAAARTIGTGEAHPPAQPQAGPSLPVTPVAGEDVWAHRVSELWDRPIPASLVKGVIPRTGTGFAYGPSGSAKSFGMIHLALSILSKRDEWMGRKLRTVDNPNVVIFAGEGEQGMVKRVKGWADHYGHGPSVANNLHLFKGHPNLSDAAEVERNIQHLKALGDVQLIIVDTLSTTSGSLSENDAGEIKVFTNNVRRMAASVGAAAVIVHHSGKDESKGLRGNSNLLADADFSIAFQKEGDRFTAEVKKSKEDADGVKLAGSLRQVVVGVDGDGDDVTTLVVDEYAPVAVSAHREPVRAAILTYLRDTSDLQPQTASEIGAACDGKPHKATVHRTLNALVAEGLVMQNKARRYYYKKGSEHA